MNYADFSIVLLKMKGYPLFFPPPSFPLSLPLLLLLSPLLMLFFCFKIYLQVVNIFCALFIHLFFVFFSLFLEKNMDGSSDALGKVFLIFLKPRQVSKALSHLVSSSPSVSRHHTLPYLKCHPLDFHFSVRYRNPLGH